jgi:hypothetical protein
MFHILRSHGICNTLLQKGKTVIVHPITSHEGPEGEWGYSSTLSLSTALGGSGGQRQALSALRPGKRHKDIV